MDLRVRAAVELDGTLLRYAEEESGRLVRVRSIETGLDLPALTSVAGSSEYHDRLRLKLDPFLPTASVDSLQVVLHPWNCVSFPICREASDPMDSGRILEEARHVIEFDPASPPSLRLHRMRLDKRAEGSLVWEQVFDVARVFTDNWSSQLASSCSGDLQFVLSSAGVAGLLETQAWPGDATIDVALGWYDEGLEVTVVGPEGWLYAGQLILSRHEDAGFFLATLLARIGLASREIRWIYWYGTSASSLGIVALEATFACSIAPLDSETGLRDREDEMTSWSSEYAACISVLGLEPPRRG